MASVNPTAPRISAARRPNAEVVRSRGEIDLLGRRESGDPAPFDACCRCGPDVDGRPARCFDIASPMHDRDEAGCREQWRDGSKEFDRPLHVKNVEEQHDVKGLPASKNLRNEKIADHALDGKASGPRVALQTLDERWFNLDRSNMATASSDWNGKCSVSGAQFQNAVCCSEAESMDNLRRVEKTLPGSDGGHA
jgi:hypothetical protein